MDEEVEFGDLKVGLAPIVVKPPYHPFPPPITVGLTADRLFRIGKRSKEVFFVNATFPRFFDDHFQPFPFRHVSAQSKDPGKSFKSVQSELYEWLP